MEELANVQITDSELQKYTSISQVQTVGLRRFATLDEVLSKKLEKNQTIQDLQTAKEAKGSGINSIKGAGKRKLLIEEEEMIKQKRKDPNILSLSNDTESETESETEEDEANEDNENHANDIKENVEETKNEGNEINISLNVNEEAVIVEDGSKNTSDPSQAISSSTQKKSEDQQKSQEKKQLQLPRKSAVFVPIHRDPEVQAARLKLPILAEEQQIMELINEHPIVILAGETGSGKTTQVPQFLYEAGYTQNGQMIGITEPRRVAAIAMSKRVANEMNLSSNEVSYLIRFEGNVTPETRIKFMTDGVLLKEIESDFLLTRYSVIILDEAHERSAYTDILVGLLSRIVPLRLKRNLKPLKLIIMSATLRVEDFTTNTKLFRNPPPQLKVESRQFPVTVHFQKRTPTDYLSEAYRKVVKIHSQLPEGGILVFLTGQQEVKHLVNKLRKSFPYQKPKCFPEKTKAEQDDKAKSPSKSDDGGDKEEEKAAEEMEFDMKRAIHLVHKSKRRFLQQMNSLPRINLDDFKLPGDDTECDLLEQQNQDENENCDLNEDDLEEDILNDERNTTLGGNRCTSQPLWVLPLYSLLSTEKQNRIFQKPPEGCRLCIVSTNVAETSLTIPNIKYVVDSGKQKTRLYDKVTGVSCFVVTFTSKASADQRAGRAGRVSSGHCYRLYSSAIYNDEFEPFAVPDIQKKPVDDLMLQMRCMGIDRVVNFPFPSPPNQEQLMAAERRLIILGALESTNKDCIEPSAEKNSCPPPVTRLGRVISRFPLSPRFGKMLALSHQQNLLPYTVCLVAALSIQEVLLEVNLDANELSSSISTESQRWHRKRLVWTSKGNFQLLGDPMVLLKSIGAAEYAGFKGNLSTFCENNGLRLKAVTEIRKIRVQLTNEINLNLPGVDLCVDPQMLPPTDEQARFLRQILLAGMGDRVAHKVSLDNITDKEERRKLKYAYNCLDMEQPAIMHSLSVLRQKLPEWIIYQEAYEIKSTPNSIGDETATPISGDSSTSKVFLRGITAIEPEWLFLYVPTLCNIKNIREDVEPRYNPEDGRIYCYVDATFGKAAWVLPPTEVEMPVSENAFW